MNWSVVRFPRRQMKAWGKRHDVEGQALVAPGRLHGAAITGPAFCAAMVAESMVRIDPVGIDGLGDDLSTLRPPIDGVGVRRHPLEGQIDRQAGPIAVSKLPPPDLAPVGQILLTRLQRCAIRPHPPNCIERFANRPIISATNASSIPDPQICSMTNRLLHPKFRPFLLQLLSPFVLDTRSLAVFRIFFAGIILLDLAFRVIYLEAHYTDAGVLPRNDCIGYFHQDRQNFSLHLGIGTFLGQCILFAVHAAAAFCLLVGYRTRIASIFVWFLLVSLHNRNPLVLSGADIYLRVCSFWTMFLPLSRHWSVDSVDSKNARPLSVLNVASVAMVLQLCVIYWLNAYEKSGDDWRVTGTAVRNALMIDAFAAPFGEWLRDSESLTRLLTTMTVYLETFAPFLFILPIKNGWTRSIGVLLFVSFHFGIGMSMGLWLFAFAMIAGLISILPPGFWAAASVLVRMGSSVRPVSDSVGHPRRPAQPMSTSSWLSKAIPPKFPLRFGVQDVVLMGLMIYSFAWAVRATNFERHQVWLAYSQNHIGDLTGLKQRWNMFAPYPLRRNAWIIVAGTTPEGNEIDILRGQTVPSFHKYPEDDFVGRRWEKFFFETCRRGRFSRLHENLARYAMMRWNRTAQLGQQVEEVTIYEQFQMVTPKGERGPVEREVIWRGSPGSDKSDGASDRRKIRVPKASERGEAIRQRIETGGATRKDANGGQNFLDRPQGDRYPLDAPSVLVQPEGASAKSDE